MSKEDVFSVTCIHCGSTEFNIPLKPGAFNKILCPNCKRNNFIIIDENLNIITLTENELCPECNGTRYVVCARCNGFGYYYLKAIEEKIFTVDQLEELFGSINEEYFGVLGCPECGGKGTFFKWDIFERFLEKVEKEIIDKKIFKGDGWVPCPTCKGRGYKL